MNTVIGQVDGYALMLNDEADDAHRADMQQRLRSFNDGASPYHQAIRSRGPAPLDLTIRDEQGTVLAGLVGETYWGWLCIIKLYVEAARRGQGWGQKLLLSAEAEARRRGCRHVHLTTYSFQARGFYEKCGYRVVGRLDDYPPGEAYYWMRKDFAEELP